MYAPARSLIDQSCKSTLISSKCFTCLVIPGTSGDLCQTVTVEDSSETLAMTAATFEYLIAYRRLLRLEPPPKFLPATIDLRFHLLVKSGQNPNGILPSLQVLCALEPERIMMYVHVICRPGPAFRNARVCHRYLLGSGSSFYAELRPLQGREIDLDVSAPSAYVVAGG